MRAPAWEAHILVQSRQDLTFLIPEGWPTIVVSPGPAGRRPAPLPVKRSFLAGQSPPTSRATDTAQEVGPRRIPVFVDHQHGIAYNKVIVIDTTHVSTGSFNVTTGACNFNQTLDRMKHHIHQTGHELLPSSRITNSYPTVDAVTAAVSRRQFLGRTVLASAGLMAGALGCSPLKSRPGSSARVAFVTANLVARVSDYRFEMAHWGDQHKKTVAATDAAAWGVICREIAATGFHAVEIWEAHAAPEVMNRERGATWKAILDEHGLKAIGYGGSLSRKTLEICQWLGIPQINGSIGDNTPGQAAAMCREMGVRFNVENHPQKNAIELLKVVDGGNDWLGVCIDTGWLGTQGASGPEVIRACGPLVRHAHIKDVKAAGAHETCMLDEGVAQVAACIATLKAIGYSGWYSWEDEPEDRNPFDSAVRNRHWLEKQLA